MSEEKNKIENLYRYAKRKIDTIIIHCTASKEGVDMTVEHIDKLHKSFGWKCIGYHFVIYKDGSIHDGRNIDVIGAHAGSPWNTGSVGIVYVGGLDAQTGKPKDTRTPEQKEALYKLVKQLIEIYPIKKVIGHRDVSPDTNHNGIIEPHEWIKACPCFEVKDWMKETGLDLLLKQ